MFLLVLWRDGNEVYVPPVHQCRVNASYGLGDESRFSEKGRRVPGEAPFLNETIPKLCHQMRCRRLEARIGMPVPQAGGFQGDVKRRRMARQPVGRRFNERECRRAVYPCGVPPLAMIRLKGGASEGGSKGGTKAGGNKIAG